MHGRLSVTANQQESDMITIIYTFDPLSGYYLLRPACEFYRTQNQATNAVLDREYVKGITTWIVHRLLSDSKMSVINPLENYF